MISRNAIGSDESSGCALDAFTDERQLRDRVFTVHLKMRRGV